MCTFYWQFWEIPWLPMTSKEGESTEDNSLGTNLPEPPNCIKDTVTALPTNRYCVWNSKIESCYETLKPALDQQTAWVFLGDTGMASLAYYASEKWPLEPLLNVTTRRHPCQNLAYYGLPPPNHDWVPPDPSLGEGPIGYGLQNPYCMDCKKCWNVLMDNPTTTTTPTNTPVKNFIEYLVVEYARDVSLPTLVTTTTQETAVYYLKRKSPAVCIASAGLHDAAIDDPPISVDLYVQNVDKYMSLLQRTCQHVVWMSIPAVVENAETMPLQTNCKLQKWNNAVLGLIAMRNYQNVYVIDIWDQSLETNHETHTGLLEKKFYDSLAQLFTSLMAGPDSPTS
jgi:hypothetical protein